MRTCVSLSVLIKTPESSRANPVRFLPSYELCYNDIIVFGHMLEEHEERLLKVLDRLKECGLKVSIDKCQFCQPKVCYVGHIVSVAGVSPDPEKN